MHVDVVRSVLREIGAGEVDELIAFKKTTCCFGNSST